MPYIAVERRNAIDRGEPPVTTGELNYKLTTVILDYLEDTAPGPLGYDALNGVIGVLECCKLEMYRRQVAPYEDAKALANGDVYSLV